jgi:hypothetical protein
MDAGGRSVDSYGGGPLERPLQPRAPAEPWLLTKIGHALAAVRWIYFPFAVMALLAVGVHAAADALDQRVLWAVDHLDAAFDAVFGRFELTASWVHWIDLDDRVRIARLVALAWELAGDWVLAIPVLGFGIDDEVSLVAQAKEVVRRPTVLRVTRPLCALALSFAGANAVAAMVHGSLFVGFRALLCRSAALLFSGVIGLGVLAALLLAFAGPAAVGHLRRADAFAREPAAKYLREVHRGLVGSVILIPLALMAALQAVALLVSFW